MYRLFGGGIDRGGDAEARAGSQQDTGPEAQHPGCRRHAGAREESISVDAESTKNLRYIFRTICRSIQSRKVILSNLLSL